MERNDFVREEEVEWILTYRDLLSRRHDRLYAFWTLAVATVTHSKR